jgi:hypothetical protein
MKALPVWPSILTITTLLLGLAALLATGSSQTGTSQMGVQQTKQTCHATTDGRCR